MPDGLLVLQQVDSRGRSRSRDDGCDSEEEEEEGSGHVALDSLVCLEDFNSRMSRVRRGLLLGSNVLVLTEHNCWPPFFSFCPCSPWSLVLGVLPCNTSTLSEDLVFIHSFSEVRKFCPRF